MYVLCLYRVDSLRTGSDSQGMENIVFSRVNGSVWTGVDYELAEGRGFEPLVGHPTTDFKSAAIDHSASPPRTTLYHR